MSKVKKTVRVSTPKKSKKKQWGLGVIYKQDGGKNRLNTKFVGIATIVLFSLFSIFSLITTEPPIENIERSLEIQEFVYNSEQIDINKPAIEVVIPEENKETSYSEYSRYDSFNKNDDKTDKVLSKKIPNNTNYNHSTIRNNVNYDQESKKPSSRGIQVFARNTATTIPPGTMIKAKLISGGSNGLVKITTLEAIKLEGATLLAKNTTLIGSGQSSEERLFIKVNKAVFKNGSVQEISAEACDESDKTVGLKGTLIGHSALKLGASVGLSVAGGVTESLQDEDKSPVKNSLLAGASRATLEHARDIMSSQKNKAPIIEVPEGKKIYILFN